ncbi:MAG: tyrosine-type recombinase/integrase [Deltaproteobacteria bacterium]|nr:tyrosine-type recombinase/integrase [Deltaproteobacteria bacterium]
MTEKQIRDASPKPKLTFLWDDRVKGLGCAIYPTGRKAFVLFYRADGKQHRVTIGRPGEMALLDARKRAGAELTGIRNGEAGPKERRQDAKDMPTVKDALERFFAETVPAKVEAGRFSPKTVENYRSQAKRHVSPLLGSMKVGRVKRRDVEQALATIPGVAQRNRVQQFISRLFSEMERWEWREGPNPCKGIEKARERARTRVLAPSERTALHAALDDLEFENSYAVPAIRLALWTGLRIDRECLSLRWENIDLEQRIANLDTKTGQRVLPLASEAYNLLASLPRHEGNPYVFRGATAGSRVQYKTARLVFAKACAAAGIEGVNLHDLKRTYLTEAAKRFPAHIVSALGDHKNQQTTMRYVHLAASDLADAAQEVSDALTGK